jgi:hypothetical protein
MLKVLRERAQTKAVGSWEKVIQEDSELKRELQPWIEKAQAKLQDKIP